MAEKKFYEMGRDERLSYLKKAANVDDIEAMLGPLPFDDANRMV